MSPTKPTASENAAYLSELLDKSVRGEINLRDALGLDPGIFAQLVDRATGLLDAKKHPEAERLLSALSAVGNFSFTLPFLLGACRQENNDLLGSIAAYSEALARADRLDAPKEFRRQVLLCRGQAFSLMGDEKAAHEDLARAGAK
jgi:hypothetical protein